jgi:hypothetical protein
MDPNTKEVACKCGNVLTVEGERAWCSKCGQPVYTDPKKQKRHRLNSLYLTVLFIGTITFLVYIYLELVAKFWAVD